MATKKSKAKSEVEVEATESSVVEISKAGVAVYKPGQHPRQLRVAAEQAAQERVSGEVDAEDEAEDEQTPDEE